MKVIGWIVAVPLIFFGLFVALRFAFCRPNYFVVKTATPVAEKIADYIVEHGLPERLDAIPGLPYELGDCPSKKIYYKNNYDKVKMKAEAEWIEVQYTCLFSKDLNLYKINARFTKTINKGSWSGKLRIESKKTVVGVSFTTEGNKQLKHSGIWAANINNMGICRAFKQ